MTREEYIAHRINNNFTTEFVYKYYLDIHVAPYVEYQKFHIMFIQWLHSPDPYTGVPQDYNRVLDRIMQEYDKKFFIRILINKDKQIIKIY